MSGSTARDVAECYIVDLKTPYRVLLDRLQHNLS